MGMIAEQYATALKALLPPGAAWVLEQGDDWERLLAALGGEMVRVEASAERLLEEADPRTTVELLPDWERVAGLPDACTAGESTLQGRRQVLSQRVAEDGDVSEAGWIARAAALGHTITLKEFKPSWCGEMVCGDELAPEEAVFLLEVETAVVLSHPFECGAAVCGDALGSWSTQRLECELSRVRQAHTRLQFNFTI